MIKFIAPCILVVLVSLTSRVRAQCTGTPCEGTNVCSNGGTCTVTGQLCSDYTCRCPSNFCGTTCQTSFTGCDSNPCSSGQTCTKSPSTNCTARCCSGFTSSFASLTGRSSKTSGCYYSDDSSADADAGCFHGDGLVQLPDGSDKAMKDLKIGDKVMVARDIYEEVYFFSHASHDDLLHEYRVLETESGRKISVTPTHYLPVYPSRMLPARLIKPGHFLQVFHHNGQQWQMVKSNTVQKLSGLYNPHTASGTIVVNGIGASTYTEFLSPALAHAALWPVRQLYQWMPSIYRGLDATEGIPTWMLIGRNIMISV